MVAIFLAGLLGMATGSFICLAADRYQPYFTNRQWLCALLFPPSHCTGCGHPVRLRDLLPLYSWLRLRGRCRYCQITLPYYLLITEIVTGLLFCALALYQPYPAPLLFSLIFSAALIVLSLIDWRHFILPDVVTLPLLWLGLLYHLLFDHQGLSAAVTGALLGWLFLWLLYWGFLAAYRQEGIGYGDIKLFAALGAWCGWQALPLIATLASLSGLMLFTYAHSVKKTVGAHCRQPFGPCLSIAGWAVFIWQIQGNSAIPLL
jgi:prepilin signal peptidase PulO-like enzyme (type II secretory pathway)